MNDFIKQAKRLITSRCYEVAGMMISEYDFEESIRDEIESVFMEEVKKFVHENDEFQSAIKEQIASRLTYESVKMMSDKAVDWYLDVCFKKVME